MLKQCSYYISKSSTLYLEYLCLPFFFFNVIIDFRFRGALLHRFHNQSRYTIAYFIIANHFINFYSQRTTEFTSDSKGKKRKAEMTISFELSEDKNTYLMIFLPPYTSTKLIEPFLRRDTNMPQHHKMLLKAKRNIYMIFVSVRTASNLKDELMETKNFC
ncbi:hypothetical protein K501DRAFT_269447 [Backusella circina FSU 941]|nr:hypothetical protein K501DRAFT_269447 [Backusella circina FSU 941]